MSFQGTQFSSSGREIKQPYQKNQIAAEQLSAMAQEAEIKRQRIITLNQIQNKTLDQINELANLMGQINMNKGGRRRRRTNKRKRTFRRKRSTKRRR